MTKLHRNATHVVGID